MPKIVGVREVLDYRERAIFFVGPTQGPGNFSWWKVIPQDQSLVINSVSGGVERYGGDTATLQQHLRLLTVHFDVGRNLDQWTSPFDVLCVHDAVLEARVRRLEAIIEAFLDPATGEKAQIMSALGENKTGDYLDHRRLQRPVLVPPAETVTVRIAWTSPIVDPLDVHLDLHGVHTREILDP